MKIYMHNPDQKLTTIIHENGAHRVYHSYKTKNTTNYYSRNFTQESTITRLISFGYKPISELTFNTLLSKSKQTQP